MIHRKDQIDLVDREVRQLIELISDCHDSIINELKCSLVACDDIEITPSESQSLVFIAGYVGHKLIANKVLCDLCKNELVYDRTLQYEFGSNDYNYLFEIDRGGLKWPTDFLLEHSWSFV